MKKVKKKDKYSKVVNIYKRTETLAYIKASEKGWKMIF